MVILINCFSDKISSDESNFYLLWPHSDTNLWQMTHWLKSEYSSSRDQVHINVLYSKARLVLLWMCSGVFVPGAHHPSFMRINPWKCWFSCCWSIQASQQHNCSGSNEGIGISVYLLIYLCSGRWWTCHLVFYLFIWITIDFETGLKRIETVTIKG